LKDGVIDNLLIVLEGGGRLAAKSGQARDGFYELLRTTYSACGALDANGCHGRPSVLFTARRASYDPKNKKIRLKAARIEIFGLELPPIPYFWTSLNNSSASGLLDPVLNLSSNHGVEVGLPVNFHISDQQDLTVEPILFSASLPALQVDYRQLLKTGAFSVSSFVTQNSVTPIAFPNGVSKELFRGYFDAQGHFQIDPEWDVQGSLRIATDRTLLASYEISYDDVLRNNLTLERVGPTSYLSISGWGVETLRPLESQGLTPIALPELDYRKRLDDPIAGGTLDLQVNTLAISRTSGQNTQRAFTGAEWNLRQITAMGQEVVLTAYARGDIYHSNDNTLPDPLNPLIPGNPQPYQGLPGWQTRGIAALAAEMRWPFIGSSLGGTLRLTPRLQVVASPPTPNINIPNEDARAVDLDDTNLFALNRFPGYDRWEDGTRITYGADWAWDRPGLSASGNIGQSYRMTASNIFLPSTGLTNRLSDIVGRTNLRWRDIIEITHRYRLDKNGFAIRRNEVDATVGGTKTYMLVSYLKLDRLPNPTLTLYGGLPSTTVQLEDLQNHEEVRAGGRVQINKHWAVFGSTIIDLTTQALNPTSYTNGFSPVRHRAGIEYEDDSLSLGFTWRRDFDTVVGAPAGNHFNLTIAFRNLGR
ncbi:MAG: LPS assembly protein LptD, partial [Alphaproteobacteria bacterium]|nr:LPS assembly protein LptD [Alphaproteobacteria bacterium]